MGFYRVTRCALVLSLVSLVLVACNAADEPSITVSAHRDTSPEVDDSDLRELAAGNNAFAFDLYQALRGGEGDLLYSPFSLSQALAMTYAGARGQTAQQMADVLHFTLAQEDLHPAFSALDLTLASRALAPTQDASSQPTDQVAFELHIASAIWGQRGYSFLTEYVDLLAQNYGVGIQPLDFERAPDAAARAINNWVSEETEGRLQNLVSELDPGTKLVLGNAIYFNAAWYLSFDENHTFEEPFYLLDREQVRVPMMHQTSHFRYTEGDDYQAIELPYLGEEVAMVILLPAEGRFREIEGQMSGEWVQHILDEFMYRHVILTMPRFGFETPPLNLTQVLSEMGMSQAFRPDADFSGIVERDAGLDFYIDSLLHKARIEVDEQRTEAAAVTIIVMKEVEKSIGEPTPPPPIIMRIDRPFVFFIHDVETNAILFVGREMNPAQ